MSVKMIGEALNIGLLTDDKWCFSNRPGYPAHHSLSDAKRSSGYCIEHIRPAPRSEMCNMRPGWASATRARIEGCDFPESSTPSTSYNPSSSSSNALRRSCRPPRETPRSPFPPVCKAERLIYRCSSRWTSWRWTERRRCSRWRRSGNLVEGRWLRCGIDKATRWQ